MLTNFEPADNTKLAASIWRGSNCIVNLSHSFPPFCALEGWNNYPLPVDGAGVQGGTERSQ